MQGLLGHSSIVMTLDSYGHLFPAADDRAELAAATSALLADCDTDATYGANALISLVVDGRLKICFWETGVPVRVRPRPPSRAIPANIPDREIRDHVLGTLSRPRICFAPV